MTRIGKRAVAGDFQAMMEEIAGQAQSLGNLRIVGPFGKSLLLIP
jgi:hypothetical protein